MFIYKTQRTPCDALSILLSSQIITNTQIIARVQDKENLGIIGGFGSESSLSFLNKQGHPPSLKFGKPFCFGSTLEKNNSNNWQELFNLKDCSFERNDFLHVEASFSLFSVKKCFTFGVFQCDKLVYSCDSEEDSFKIDLATRLQKDLSFKCKFSDGFLNNAIMAVRSARIHK